jgi:phosphohistidine phosphatase
MRRLMLLRHAKTESDAPSGRDQDRRLDERGRSDAAVRARQTWELAWTMMQARVPEPQVEWVAELYGAEAVQLLHSIRIAHGSDPRRLMLVGHNPGMHELALALTGDGNAAERHELARNLPTSGLAIFDFEIEDWSDVSFGRGRLITFVTPRLLKHRSPD